MRRSSACSAPSEVSSFGTKEEDEAAVDGSRAALRMEARWPLEGSGHVAGSPRTQEFRLWGLASQPALHEPAPPAAARTTPVPATFYFLRVDFFGFSAFPFFFATSTVPA